jgi:hypothetical protein
MSIDRLAQLKALHLYGMAAAWTELLAEGPRQPMRPEAWLDRLIEAEQADRQSTQSAVSAQGSTLSNSSRFDGSGLG